MKETYDKEVDYISGETVVGGSYRCRQCDYELEIEEGKVTNLPVCPRCQSQHWDTAR
jgi:predicted Zn-ribbon and HTH transcriptional regulator